MKRILFIVSVDKWTEGFYKFINKNFLKQENWFVFYGSIRNYAFLTENDNCFWCESFRELKKQRKVYEYARTCDAIIYSGIFGCEKSVLSFGFQSLKKSYFQLWGGDYSCLKNLHQMNAREKLSMYFRKFVLRNAKAVINLIPNEYDELNQLCRIKGKHLIAPMPDDGTIPGLLRKLHGTIKNNNPIKIQVGNSATPTNCHTDILEKLMKFVDEDITIICPLSYGENEYAEQIDKLGKKLFGNKFVALRDYMSLKEYFNLLAEVKVAIFNNDRQQAMGNINAAAALGCKVYIRRDTPMWDAYAEKGFSFSDVSDIEDMEFNSFINISEEEKTKNFNSFNEYYDESVAVKAWKNVFETIE